MVQKGKGKGGIVWFLAVKIVENKGKLRERLQDLDDEFARDLKKK